MPFGDNEAGENHGRSEPCLGDVRLDIGFVYRDCACRAPLIQDTVLDDSLFVWGGGGRDGLESPSRNGGVLRICTDPRQGIVALGHFRVINPKAGFHD